MKPKSVLALCAALALFTGKAAAQHAAPDTVYAVVEEDARFPGDSLYAFLGHQLHYPKSLRTKGVTGRLIVQLVIASNGTVADAKVVRSSGQPLMDEEALRVMRLMPAWKPAQLHGRDVASFYRIPVAFRL